MRKQVLFIAIFAILLSGCGNQQQQKDDQAMMEDENVTQITEETTTTETETGEIIPEYDLNADLNKVDEIKNDENREVADCDGLVDESLKSRCINDVLLFQALEAYDTSICDQMNTDSAKSSCKARVENALATKSD